MRSIFDSHETGAPFAHCFACRLPLEDIGQPHLVSKSFHRGECVFEYSLCEDCRSHLCEEFSEPSQQALAGFFLSRANLFQRSEALTGNWSTEAWLERCVLCNGLRGDSESYSIGGLFLARGILFDPYPLCICGKCEEEVQECLSKSTRDIWDDFLATHFDGPPANRQDLPVGGRPLIF